MKVIRNIYYFANSIHKAISYRTNAISASNKYLHVSTNKYLTCHPRLHVEIRPEGENKHAYNILENKGYAVSFNSPPLEKEETLSKEKYDELMRTNWSKQEAKDIFEALPKLGEYCSRNELCISDKIFDDYIDSLTDHVRHASDKELEYIFYSLSKWPATESIKTRNYIEVWVALDDVCLSRVNQWTFDEMLVFVSLFYKLNVSKMSDFTWKCMRKMASRAKQLTPSQFVQAMFFISVLRKQPFDMHNCEIKLTHDLSKFSADDLAIISMGFFKSKTPIRNLHLVSQIMDVVIENAKSIHEVSLAAILKVIRYSMKINPGDQIDNLLEVLQYEVPRLSVMCNVHLAILGTATLTLHKGCLNAIAEKVSDCIASSRIKDLERLVLTYGTFNMVSDSTKCLTSKIIDELRKPEREEEIKTYSRSFACCVSFLHIMELYPIDLMNKVLSPQFLELTYGKHYYNYGREILAIHNSAQLFCENTEMNRLTDNTAKLLAKKYTDYVPDEKYSKQFNVSEKMCLDVLRVLKDSRGGVEFVVGDHIVTHHQRGDIILCNSPEGTPLPITDHFNNSKFGLLRKAPDDNIWIALVIAGRNAQIHGSCEPTGHLISKIRELNTLGYKAALIQWSIYSTLETDEQKNNYLNELINRAISPK